MTAGGDGDIWNFFRDTGYISGNLDDVPALGFGSDGEYIATHNYRNTFIKTH